MSHFGDQIRAFRHDRKKKLREAAVAIGYSLSHYSDIERGRRAPPDDERIVKLADFFEVPSEDLLDAARLTKGVRLTVDDESPIRREAALALSRCWDLLSEADLSRLVEMLQACSQSD